MDKGNWNITGFSLGFQFSNLRLPTLAMILSTGALLKCQMAIASFLSRSQGLVSWSFDD